MSKEKVFFRCSDSIIGFKDKIAKTLKLKERDRIRNVRDPVLFFGMYHSSDWFSFIRHKGKRYVLWAGGDLINLKRNYAFSDGNNYWGVLSKLFRWFDWSIIFRIFEAQHFVENEMEQDELLEMGIESTIVPTFLEDVKDFPVSFRPSKNPELFISARPGREDKYGVDLVRRISPLVPFAKFHIYGVDGKSEKNIQFHGLVPPKQFNQEIRKYHSGLRPNEHDGNSEIAMKSVLMGQYPITRIEYPHIWSYQGESRLINLIKELRNQKEPNLKARRYWQKSVNKFPFLDK